MQKPTFSKRSNFVAMLLMVALIAVVAALAWFAFTAFLPSAQNPWQMLGYENRGSDWSSKEPR